MRDHGDALQQLKEKVSIKLLLVGRELAEIEELFAAFQQENQAKLNGRPVFKHGSKPYEDSLRFD